MVIRYRPGVFRLGEDEVGEEIDVEMAVGREGVDLDEEEFPDIGLLVDHLARAVIACYRFALVIAYQYQVARLMGRDDRALALFLDAVEQFVQVDHRRVGLELGFLLEVGEQRMIEDEIGEVDDDLRELQRAELREELAKRYGLESLPAIEGRPVELTFAREDQILGVHVEDLDNDGVLAACPQGMLQEGVESIDIEIARLQKYFMIWNLQSKHQLYAPSERVSDK